MKGDFNRVAGIELERGFVSSKGELITVFM